MLKPLQYEWNARTQITMWFDNTETKASLLRDYGKTHATCPVGHILIYYCFLGLLCNKICCSKQVLERPAARLLWAKGRHLLQALVIKHGEECTFRTQGMEEGMDQSHQQMAER